jgi:hypothetical protein
VNVPNSFKITYRLFRGDTSDPDPIFYPIFCFLRMPLFWSPDIP